MACNKVRIHFAAVAALGLWCAASAQASSVVGRPAGIELACAADLSTHVVQSGLDIASDLAGLTLADAASETATAAVDPALLEQLASEPKTEQATLAVPEPATIGIMGLAALFGGIAYSRYRLG